MLLIHSYPLPIQDFSCALLHDCITVGLERTKYQMQTPSMDTSHVRGALTHNEQRHQHILDPSQKPLILDPLLRTACTTLLSRVHGLVSSLASQHRVVRTDSRRETDRVYRAKLMQFFTDGEWCDRVYDLAGALVKYLVSARTLGQNVPGERLDDIGQFAITCLEVKHFKLVLIIHSFLLVI